MNRIEVKEMVLHIAESLGITQLINTTMHDAYFDALRWISLDAAREGARKLCAEWDKGWLPKPAEIKKYCNLHTGIVGEIKCVCCGALGRPGSNVDEILTHYADRSERGVKYNQYPAGSGSCYRCRVTNRIKSFLNDMEGKTTVCVEDLVTYGGVPSSEAYDIIRGLRESRIKSRGGAIPKPKLNNIEKIMTENIDHIKNLDDGG